MWRINLGLAGLRLAGCWGEKPEKVGVLDKEGDAGDPGFPDKDRIIDLSQFEKDTGVDAGPGEAAVDAGGLQNCDPLNDEDGDKINDCDDNCPFVANTDQADTTDLDGIGDLCDDDWDQDSVPNNWDNCPLVGNRRQTDSDLDGVGDNCDNCDFVLNPGQEDRDRDRVGDACDNCPDHPNDGQEVADRLDITGETRGEVCTPSCKPEHPVQYIREEQLGTRADYTLVVEKAKQLVCDGRIAAAGLFPSRSYPLPMSVLLEERAPGEAIMVADCVAAADAVAVRCDPVRFEVNYAPDAARVVGPAGERVLPEPQTRFTPENHLPIDIAGFQDRNPGQQLRAEILFQRLTNNRTVVTDEFLFSSPFAEGPNARFFAPADRFCPTCDYRAAVRKTEDDAGGETIAANLRDGDFQYFSTSDAGLALYYRFPEGEGRESRDAGSLGQNIRWTGEDGPPWQNGVEGNRDTAAVLNGMEGYFATDPLVLPAADGRTWGTWFYKEGEKLRGDQILMAYRSVAGGFRLFYRQQDRRLVCEIGEDGVSADTGVFNVPVENFGWHQAICVLNGNHLRLYLDDGLRADAAVPVGIGLSESPFSVGADPLEPESLFLGKLDEVTVYNRALSDGEIAARCRSKDPDNVCGG